MSITSRRQFMGWAAAGFLAPAAVGEDAAEPISPDATRTLQQAADAGGVLELGPGTYRITEPLVLDTTKCGYVGVRGAQGTARIVMAGPGPAIRVVGDHQGTAKPGTVQPHTWERERFPVLSGFEIVGAHPEADGIELFRTMQAVIERVSIRKCRYGVHLSVRNRNVIITNCHIYDCSDSGIFMDDVSLHQINILGNHISYCQHGGIRQFNGDVHNVQITGNDIEYNSGYDGLSCEILLEAPDSGLISEYTIASNTLQATPDAQGANVAIVGRDNDFTVGEVAISGNVLGSRNKNVYARNAQRELTITGNTIYTGVAANVHLVQCANVVVGTNTVCTSRGGLKDFGDQGGILLEDCAACSLTGNVVRGTTCGDADRGGAVGLVRCRDTAVASCQILNPGFRGIYLEDSARCRISDNTIVSQGDGAPMVAAISVTGSGSDNVIQNNLVAKGSKGDIVCGPDGPTLLNNTVVQS